MRGDGRIFRRGGRYWIALYVDAREIRESAGWTEQAARELLRQRRRERDDGRPVLPEQRRVTVKELLDAYAENLALAERRLDPSALDWLARELGPRRANELSLPWLERWTRGHLEAGLGRGTVRMRLAYLRAAYR